MKLNKIFAIVVSFLGFQMQVYADHVAGGQITYKHVSSVGNNSTYEVEVQVYGDCSGSTFPSWGSTTGARFYIYKDGILNLVHMLPRINAESDILISPVCPTAINQTTCSGGNIVGIKKYTFRGNIVLNETSANWRFVFTDELPGGQAPGRSSIADNVSNPGMFYTEATLNNLNGPNNSATFNANPVPFYCQGVSSSFEVSAMDVDGDSLVYSLAPVQTAANAIAAYNAGYSANNPLNVVPGSFTFSSQTGVAEFLPNTSSWEGIVVNKVSEYRNGVLIGTVMREMMFVFLANCQNQAPTTPISNIANGSHLNSSTVHKNEFNTCSGQNGVFGFSVNAIDPDQDNISISYNNLPQGATISILNNGSQNPQLTFSWSTATTAPGSYHFYVTYEDDGCPLPSVKTVVYVVNVQAFEGDFSTSHVSPCRYQSNGYIVIEPAVSNAASFSYSWLDPSFNVLQAATPLQTNGDTLLNIGSGNYLVQVKNEIGCMRQFSVHVDSPTYRAQFETDSFVCVNTNLNFNPSHTNSEFATRDWQFGNGQSSNEQFPNIQYANSGEYTIQLIASTADGCADTATQMITVDSIMRPEFDLERNEICAREQVTIAASLGENVSRALWNFGDSGTLQSVDTLIKYAYPLPGVYQIVINVAYRACPNVIFSRSVTVHDYPKVDLGADTGLCYQGTAILLKNIAANEINDRLQWNTGATSESIYANHHGVYSLTVTRNDCSTTDSVTIHKDCYIDIPNAFAPGSGDASGYFLPRSILSKGVSQFQMLIYNRWGQLVFQTQNIDGRGWDGNFNGQAQAQGVYVYQIDVVYKDGKSEKYQGNVTLLR